MVEQRPDAGPVVGPEDRDDHHFARRSGAHHQVAHQPLVRPGVVERVAVFQTETLGFQPDGIRRFGLQPALADVEHLVEHAGDVEPRSGFGLDVAPGSHLLTGEPAPVGEGEFELVAVELRMLRT